MASTVVERPCHVAIVGGGIAGVTLALGLHLRNVSFMVYERSPSFREIGAGFSFGPNSEQAMHAIHPGIHAAFKSVATPNEAAYFHWMDGFETGDLLFKLKVDRELFQGCRRADFLQELVKLLPMEKVRLGSEFVDVSERDDGQLCLHLADGTNETCDFGQYLRPLAVGLQELQAKYTSTVVGCDGIWSRVRQTMLGRDHPAAGPGFTNAVCYRALVPMEKARLSIGSEKTSSRFMYNGPGGHAITYPVGHGSMLNVLVVTIDSLPWHEPRGKTTSRGSKEEVVKLFEFWHATVRAIVDLLPDELEKWAIFDHFDNPAPAYNKGLVCLAGDAAHAMGPHLGSGAGMGLEDSAVLLRLITRAKEIQSLGSVPLSRAKLLEAALQVYNDVRYDRTQWVVRNTREACDMYHWQHPNVGKAGDDFGDKIETRLYTVWNFKVQDMLDEAVQRFDRMVKPSPRGQEREVKSLGN